MNKKYIIVALRAMHPIIPIYGINIDAVPGYLQDATENHRSGIYVKSLNKFIAFTLLVNSAKRFNTKIEAEAEITHILESDNGWLRPLTIFEIYE